MVAEKACRGISNKGERRAQRLARFCSSSCPRVSRSSSKASDASHALLHIHMLMWLPSVNRHGFQCTKWLYWMYDFKATTLDGITKSQEA